MFTGEYQHTLDNKGRVIIPARLREGLGESFIITRGLDRCIFVYHLDEWARIEQKVKELPLTRRDARAFSRYLFSGAAEVEIDRQGRVLIPQSLREYAGIEKEVMIIGVSNRVEVWSEEAWKEYISAENLDFEAAAEKLADLVF
ncbi:MAG: division/cell wall cluster transcriptional repressor MraZ [Dethiobacteria bacterium]|jgi:MraZ protein|nr:division/cell wall cluster transcriptional repressor MraZ [Bacillota bacterium]NMD33113.1 division/cell wall cluster transcriptional repressor MraZ [Bacillota bacterium]HOB28161.1 division/cell wall cluster transcriptional repressor MraZ [Bacillota bacterium]HPZ40768.1 division/cell wall cluster transcriptional repressor MraZ [Bacillota bacterium]HQD51727.1 division/cell wall cluster transcriptional repressor MraZ [Bacillota bacterium]